LKKLSGFYGDKNIKGEIVLLISGATDKVVDWSKVEQQLKDALKSMSVKDSAESVALALNVSRRDVYQLALKIKSHGE
jgi:16S rRNA (cytidine1402-2'-O)-methyltransferase